MKIYLTFPPLNCGVQFFFTLPKESILQETKKKGVYNFITMVIKK